MSKIKIRNNDDINERISLLINSRLIFCYSDDNRSEKEILRIYKDAVVELKKIPTFQFILETVKSYNWDVFYDAACMKFDRIYGQNYDTASEEIHDLACDMEEDYNLTDNSMLNFYVGHVLKKHMLSCEIEPQDDIFHEDGMIAVRSIRDVRIIANDCQNILFFQFLYSGVAGYGDFVNYYWTEINSDTLLLNGR
jgi:hypothetical protein